MKHGLGPEEAFMMAVNTLEYSSDDEQLLQAAKSLKYLLHAGYTFGIRKGERK